MKLVFIYGPPASGKLTVASELARLTGYKIFHNHTSINALTSLFPFEDRALNEVRRRLGRKFRLEIFHEAAINNIDFITTFGTAGPRYFDFFREVQESVSKSGEVLFVQLFASKEALLERVEHESRKGTKIDSVDQLEKLFEQEPELFDKFPDLEHLTIDSTEPSPLDCAKKITEYYALPIGSNP